MKKILFLTLTVFLPFLSVYAQWDTTTVSNEVSTTDEIVGPVLRISNEIRIPNTFIATDPTIGTLDNSHFGINLHKTDGIGFAFNGIHQMVFKPNGDAGIGTSSPLQKLHVSAQNSGDAVLLLEADINNGNEANNARIELLQDGGLHGAFIGFDNTWGGTAPDNIFRIGTRQGGNNFYNNIALDTYTNYVGIGTANPEAKLHVSTETSGNAIFRLEADIDNNNESDNPIIQLRQDGGQVGVNMGFSEGDFGGNIFGIGTRFTNQDAWNTFAINTSNGNVGIGTTSPDTKLTVKGNIHAEEVKVDLSVPGPDYVFKEGYDLMTLEEVQNYIKENGHLPNIPSAQEMETNGIQLGEMNMKLLEKIEELTLYLLEQQEEILEIKELNSNQSQLIHNLLTSKK